MDFHELFMSCRRGEIDKVRYLVEHKEVSLNVRDKWDSTPLYYACLCGHEELVYYLLQNGARCEANTFDGERCLYAALNDDVRRLLRSYKVITSKTMRRDVYSEFLRRLMDNDTYKDVTFDVRGRLFPVHKCVLSARSEYFAELFKTRWANRNLISIRHALVLPHAFERVISYLYTGSLEVPVDDVPALERLAKQCRLHDLIAALEAKKKEVLSFESTKPGVSVAVICIETLADFGALNVSFGKLADQAAPTEASLISYEELPFAPERELTYTDVCFTVAGHRFMCHKAFFASRSDYFKALLQPHFCSENGYSHEVVLHDVQLEIFTCIVYYVYQEACELNFQNVYEVLLKADLYLLPGLKRQCASYMGQFIDTTNVVSLLRIGRIFKLPRLEGLCCEYIASNVEDMVESDELAELIVEDAESIKGRQEIDTIEVVDDIRFHITQRVQTYSDMEEANNKLVLIDNLLARLRLDA